MVRCHDSDAYWVLVGLRHALTFSIGQSFSALWHVSTQRPANLWDVQLGSFALREDLKIAHTRKAATGYQLHSIYVRGSIYVKQCKSLK